MKNVRFHCYIVNDWSAMSKYLLTLVSSLDEIPLASEHFRLIDSLLPGGIVGTVWLCKGKAADLLVADEVSGDDLLLIEKHLAEYRIDFFFQKTGVSRKKKLFISDMDSTIIAGETFDELAKLLGVTEQVAKITHEAMNGELEFVHALEMRINLLKGVTVEVLGSVLQSIKYSRGAEQLLRTMIDYGTICVLVSGGLKMFSDEIGNKLGFHKSYGTVVEIKDGRLTGKIDLPVVDQARKRFYLEKYLRENQFVPENCLAVGDGANDLLMIQRAGLGVGFHPKPYLKKHLINNILYGDLTALLYAQGYSNL